MPHEQPDMPAGNQPALDQIGVRTEQVAGAKNLLGRRDIVLLARQQVGGYGYVFKVQRPPERAKSAVGKPVFLEQLADPWR